MKRMGGTVGSPNVMGNQRPYKVGERSASAGRYYAVEINSPI
ncbi:hypothetical protein [Calycomorphotria hydatis]|uniref:Uncharacterized protein n=1 Tax=Calycomorphotria hydatis TaxID=2528027 RepID=A0A517TCQ3_9PLAN|nr:hypothetical protein [Calycomorphotria hydatis]QDT66159.1 hypothetical protein V22_34240 [Calycomorphotria hydatis]